MKIKINDTEFQTIKSIDMFIDEDGEKMDGFEIRMHGGPLTIDGGSEPAIKLSSNCPEDKYPYLTLTSQRSITISPDTDCKHWPLVAVDSRRELDD